MITYTCPLGPNVPLSNNGILEFTHLLSTYLLAYTLSKAFATIVSPSKNWSLNMSEVPSWTLSSLASICPFNSGFIYIAAAAAVDDLGLRICFSLNKNYLLRLETSMTSGSVRIILPLVPSPIIAKFFNNSHPIAPAPTIKSLQS